MTSAVSSLGIVLPALLLVTWVTFVAAGNGGYGGSGQSLAHPAQSPLLEELRHRIQGLDINPLWVTESNLRRLLVETGYRVNRAIRRLRRTASFRARIRADNLLDSTPAEFLSTNLPYECSGYANDGSPVILFPVGRWDITRVLRTERARKVYEYTIRMLEDARSRIHGSVNPKTGEPADQVIIIVDVKGFSLKKLFSLRGTWTLLRAVYAIDRHYPFLAQKLYVVNASPILHAVWKLARMIVSPTLQRAIEIYSAFTNRGNNALAHYIPRDAIPTSLGGTYSPKYEQRVPQASSYSSAAFSLSNALASFSSAAGAPWPSQNSYSSSSSSYSSSYSPTFSSNVQKYHYSPSPPPKSHSEYGVPSAPETNENHSEYGVPSAPETNENSLPEGVQSTEYSSPVMTLVTMPMPIEKNRPTPASLQPQPQYGAPPAHQTQYPQLIAPWELEGYA